MAFQAVPGAASVTLTFRRPSTGSFAGQHVLHFKKFAGGEFTASDLELLAETLVTWFNTYYKVIMSDDVSLVRMELRGLATAIDDYLDYPVAIAGTQAAELLSSKMTLAIAFKTGLTGRSARGRAYMVGLVESQVEGDTVTSAYAGAVVDCWEELALAVEGEGFVHVVVSRRTAGEPRTTGVMFDVTTYILTDDYVDVQRDRGND